jgi:ABC-2 type transport system ATP-binding protein
MIEARGLSRRFGEFFAVDDVSLRVPPGALLALLGPNGAGKTTTVRLLTGLLAPTVGEATVAGYDVRREPARVRARVGLVTDVPGLYEQMTPSAYLDFFGRIYGLDAEARKRRIDAMLSLFDLHAHRDSRMAGFSRGMQQRLALARALLHEPAALFLDEPTAGLDPLAARMVRDLIVGLKHAQRSIILCTHDLDEAERLADQIAILRRGRVVASDAPAALRAGASPDALVEITLVSACPEAATLAAQAPHVTDPRVSGLLVSYRTRAPDETNPLVIAALVRAGARIVSVSCTKPSLEDVYATATA